MLDAIQALTPDALHAALAVACQGWQPLTDLRQQARTGCTHVAPDGGLYRVPAFTEDWGLTMALANTAHITRRWEPVIERQEDGRLVRHPGAWTWVYHVYAPDGLDGRALHVPADADDTTHRRRLCELALWQAWQGGEEGTDEPF